MKARFILGLLSMIINALLLAWCLGLLDIPDSGIRMTFGIFASLGLIGSAAGLRKLASGGPTRDKYRVFHPD